MLGWDQSSHLQGEHCRRVLVVEENAADQVLLREALRQSGCPCVLEIVESGREALELLRSGQEFALILCDLIPDLEALEFIRTLRGLAEPVRSTPVIVVSAFLVPHLAYDAGANAFVGKDMDLHRYMSKIGHTMHFWLEVAELPKRTRLRHLWEQPWRDVEERDRMSRSAGAS